MRSNVSETGRKPNVPVKTAQYFDRTAESRRPDRRHASLVELPTKFRIGIVDGSREIVPASTEEHELRFRHEPLNEVQEVRPLDRAPRVPGLSSAVRRTGNPDQKIIPRRSEESRIRLLPMFFRRHDRVRVRSRKVREPVGERLPFLQMRVARKEAELSGSELLLHILPEPQVVELLKRPDLRVVELYVAERDDVRMQFGELMQPSRCTIQAVDDQRLVRVHELRHRPLKLADPAREDDLPVLVDLARFAACWYELHLYHS